MKIYLVRPSNGPGHPGKGAKLPAKLPYPEADHAILATDCPECGSHDCKLQGCGRRPSADDQAWEADAVALCCGRYVGTLRVETGTLFGVREDEQVARMGIRIY